MSSVDESSLLKAADHQSGIPVVCMATQNGGCDFKPQQFTRRAVGPHDVLIDMKFCGICHSDLHQAHGDLGAIMAPKYPCVPGHELAGVCTAVGAAVTKIAVVRTFITSNRQHNLNNCATTLSAVLPRGICVNQVESTVPTA